MLGSGKRWYTFKVSTLTCLSILFYFIFIDVFSWLPRSVFSVHDTDSAKRYGSGFGSTTLLVTFSFMSNYLNIISVCSVWKMVDDLPRDGTGHVNKFWIFKQFSNVPVLCFHDSKL